MSAEEATVNADGSTTFQEPLVDNEEIPVEDTPPVEDEILKEAAKGIDPAVYLLIVVIAAAALYYFFVHRKKAKVEEGDGFFSNLDGDKFNVKLPAEVEEYYAIKEKAEASGWVPGQNNGPAVNSNGPSRILAQALMKRAIADIPMVTHIQKESAGMNKLYSQSMCSVNQWRSYQAAEAMVSAEVEEVRAEADEVEPGWSQVIWRQAMQYHTVLKQKHEEEQKQAEELAKKRKEIEERVQAAKAAELLPAGAAPAAAVKAAPVAAPANDEAAKEKAAELAAEELIKMEEREAQSKKAFSGAGKTMKKGFLETKGKKKK